MRVLGILVLAIALAGCRGDRIEQGRSTGMAPPADTYLSLKGPLQRSPGPTMHSPVGTNCVILGSYPNEPIGCY
jgi:hypothetical protein